MSEPDRPRPPLPTPFTALFGIDHPIVQGGMQWIGRAELTAAVAEAGGLGFLTAMTQPDTDALRREIDRCREMTSRPFGVNITMLPAISPPDYPGIARAIVAAGIDIVETAGSLPADVLDVLLDAGVRVLHKCTTLRHALSARARGVHALSIDGFECAGHPGEEDVPGLVLVPRAADLLDIPFVASGGFADGRGLAAALALGAHGVNMGTRFLCTREAPAHERVKQRIVAGTERDTELIFRPLRNTARVARNTVSAEVVRRLGERPRFDAVRELVAGSRGRRVFETGDLEAGIWTVGLSQALIHDIPTVADLMDRLVADAASIIGPRSPVRPAEPGAGE
ncbi:nitronate monooxygenase [Nocardia rhamnosiphila]|uniref:Nitronate monooxygenase n=1 Tax=Nocardia rhamnosiphila TaxID=426716 RepID=A0ABV2WJR3_9NOCA|nr:nitronate monooxygenase [Nocardia rhamnosiphila]